MNTFVLEIWDDESLKVTYYSVRFDDLENNETDRFFYKYAKDPAFRTDLQELNVLLLTVMGEEHGAVDAFFSRTENHAQALPPKSHSVTALGLNYAGFSLRLFCYRINESLVVLFNGGEKTSQSAQDSPALSLKFIEANQFVQKIEEALREGMISVDEDGRTLRSFNGSDEIVL